MASILRNASMARIPARALDRLGRLRAHAGVRALLQGEQCWVAWDGAADVLAQLLVVPGVEFLEQRGPHWYRCGCSLPTFDVPQRAFAPLAGLITPAPVAPAPAAPVAFPRVVLALRRSDQPRPATAMLCTPAALAAWAEMAPTRHIEALQSARAGDTLLLMGANLPPLQGAERLWGERVLCPLGWAPTPDLPESALLEAIGAGGDELAILRQAAIELVPRHALAPMTRAGARLGAA